ncbi:UNVERIFIED_CONTAM: hypothetical protein HDU68_009812 [Siphonaria sp. JEL0065]|nr:hypothetical protein HDU68_009812 [Siphonaria sp. JEL0065]
MTPPIKSPTDHPRIFHCMWNTISSDPALRATTQRCPNTFDTANELFIHLSEDHIGRRTLGSLQLNCEWIGCVHPTRNFAKRDNAVSHVRSHVHFRANICQDCQSHYKWPQDLKKHCLRTGHAYVEPDGKGKPGPSQVYVVDDKDGSGPTLVRLAPSLTGGRQKAFQRFAGAEGSLRTSSTTLKPTVPKVDAKRITQLHLESSPSAASSSASPTLEFASSVVSASPKESAGLPVLPSIASLLTELSNQETQDSLQPKPEYQESPAHSEPFGNHPARSVMEVVINPRFYNQVTTSNGLLNQHPPYPPTPQSPHDSYHVRAQPPSHRVQQQIHHAVTHHNNDRFPQRPSPYQVHEHRLMNPGFRVVPPHPLPSQYSQHAPAWQNQQSHRYPRYHHPYHHQPPQQYTVAPYNTPVHHAPQAYHY